MENSVEDTSERLARILRDVAIILDPINANQREMGSVGRGPGLNLGKRKAWTAYLAAIERLEKEIENEGL